MKISAARSALLDVTHEIELVGGWATTAVESVEGGSPSALGGAAVL
jgi:hypothetical protein